MLLRWFELSPLIVDDARPRRAMSWCTEIEMIYRPYGVTRLPMRDERAVYRRTSSQGRFERVIDDGPSIFVAAASQNG
jgi:hypothetical protein